MSTLWIVILIIAIIIAYILHRNHTNSIQLTAVDDLAPEVFELLQRLQSFLEINNFERSYGYLVMIIPINAARELYAPDSCCLQISIYLHRDEMYRLKGMDKLNNEAYNWHGAKFFAKGFYFISDLDCPPRDIQECGVDTYYVTRTESKFSCNYKKIMKELYPKVAAAFPDIEFKFDGSRIHTNKFHK